MKSKFYFIPLQIMLATLILTGCKEEPNENDTSSKVKTTLECSANGVNFTMILVEHGSFVKGEMTQYLYHTPVILTKDYYIGKYEVTQELWEAVMGTDANPSTFKGADLPVNSVSWNDCNAFIDKLNELTGKKFRLPTECEWEFAARSGKKLEPYMFSGSNNPDEVAWYKDNSENRIHAVGEKKANALGLYDMTGNAMEWIQNPFIQGYYQTDTLVDPNPTDANPQFRILKGACYTLAQGKEEYLSVSATFFDIPTSTDAILGMRLALTK